MVPRGIGSFGTLGGATDTRIKWSPKYFCQFSTDIRQADGDNPIAVRGCMIVKQTTENEKKSKLIFFKNRKVACDIF